MPQYLSFPGRYKSYAKHCSHAGDHVQHTRTFKYTVYTPIKSACSFVLIRGSLPYQLVYLDCHQDFGLSVLNASSSSIILCYTDQGDHAAVSERESDTELGLVCPSRSKHKALPSRVPPRTFLTCQRTTEAPTQAGFCRRRSEQTPACSPVGAPLAPAFSSRGAGRGCGHFRDRSRSGAGG